MIKTRQNKMDYNLEVIVICQLLLKLEAGANSSVEESNLKKLLLYCGVLQFNASKLNTGIVTSARRHRKLVDKTVEALHDERNLPPFAPTSSLLRQASINCDSCGD